MQDWLFYWMLCGALAAAFVQLTGSFPNGFTHARPAVRVALVAEHFLLIACVFFAGPVALAFLASSALVAHLSR